MNRKFHLAWARGIATGAFVAQWKIFRIKYPDETS